MLGIVQPGAKRKFEDMEGQRLYPEEPQAILNISMCKLRMPTTRREPSLRRSVLIFNTLRHMERELKHQGVSLPPAGSNIWPALQPEDMAMDTLDSPPGAEVLQEQAAVCPVSTPLCPAQMYNAAPLTPYHNPYEDSLMCIDFNTSYTLYSETPRQADHLDTDSSGESSDDSNDGFPDSPGAPVSPEKVPCSSYLDLDSSSNTSALSSWTDISYSNLASNLAGQNTLVSSSVNMPSKWTSSATPTFTTLQTFSTLASSVATSMASYTGQQDPFGDIDISMYDFDLSAISPTMKLAPVSAEDLMHSFPSDSAYKTDLLSEDLDHIMQVLVGI